MFFNRSNNLAMREETLTYGMGGVSVVETKAGSVTQTAYVISKKSTSLLAQDFRL